MSAWVRNTVAQIQGTPGWPEQVTTRAVMYGRGWVIVLEAPHLSGVRVLASARDPTKPREFRTLDSVQNQLEKLGQIRFAVGPKP